MRRSSGGTHLSDREREVLFLAAEGLTDKEIAARLEIRTKTVRTYWDRIRAKLGAASRTQALALALRAAYEDLAEREGRLRTFVDSMPVAFFAFSDDLTVIACNREAQTLTGYSEAELSGTRKIYELTLPEERSRIRVFRNWQRTGGEFRNWEVPIVRKDGSKRIVSWSSNSQDNPIPGWRTWAVGVDVTHVRDSDDKLRFLVQSAEEGMWLLDLSFQTQLVNRRMADLLGTDVETLYQTTPLDYIADEDLPAAQAVIAQGGGENLPFRFQRCDGKFVGVRKWLRPFITSTGETIGFLILVTEEDNLNDK